MRRWENGMGGQDALRRLNVLGRKRAWGPEESDAVRKAVAYGETKPWDNEEARLGRQDFTV